MQWSTRPLKALEEFIDGTHSLATASRFGGAITNYFRTRLNCYSEIAVLEHVERFLTGLHNGGQRSIARFIEPQICSDNGRQRQSDGFNTMVGLAFDTQLAIGQFDSRRKRSLRPIKQGGKKLSGLVRIVVDSLFPHEHEQWLFAFDDRVQKSSYVPRVQRFVARDMDGA